MDSPGDSVDSDTVDSPGDTETDSPADTVDTPSDPVDSLGETVVDTAADFPAVGGCSCDSSSGRGPLQVALLLVALRRRRR